MLSYCFAALWMLRGERISAISLMRGMLTELVATLVLMPFLPLWWLIGESYQAREPGHGDGRRRNPVILVHGLALTHTSWLFVGHYLARRGLGPIYGTTYFSFQSVAVSAEKLSRTVAAVRARENADRVDLVGHSLGGVVARAYIEKLGGAAHVGRLITIGSPHRGTLYGRMRLFSLLGLLPSVHQVGTSNFVDPPETIANDPRVTYHAIWSRADAVILPPRSSSLEPRGKDVVFDNIGHLALLLSRRVVRTIFAQLSA